METEVSLPHLQVPAAYPTLSQINPAHASKYLNIHVNIIHPSTPRSSKWSLPLRFPHQNPVFTSPLHHTCYMSRPSHSSRFDHRNNIWWAVQIILHSPVTSSLLIQILPSAPYSQTPSTFSRPSMWDQVSHPYKATCKSIVVYFLFLSSYFWIANWKTKDFAPNDSKRSLTSVSS